MKRGCTTTSVTERCRAIGTWVRYSNTVAGGGEALGLKDSSLRQMLYQARAKNPSGLDTEIVIRGVEIGYCDKSRSMNKDQSSQIVLPPQPEVYITSRTKEEHTAWVKEGAS